MKKNAQKISMGIDGIHDARALGVPRMLLLGCQHAFAMFGATVLVPLLTGIDVSIALLMAGVGTLLFHLLTKGKVPAFLGSSFAFLGGYALVAPLENGLADAELLQYACGGVVIAGLLYVVLSALFKVFGAKKVMRFFPPVVTGPIIISIGLILSPTAINSCSSNWLLAAIALAAIIVCNIWGKGMIKIIPIIIGIAVSYIVACLTGAVDFTVLEQAKWLGLPPISANTIAKFDANHIITMAPIAIAAMMEHIGDISAISATTGKNFIADPGLHRTLLGDGLATSLSAMFGGPANTTYGENTGVLALTKVYDPRVIRIAACFAVILAFIPKIAAFISTIPAAIIGGISLILYGMISSIGARNLIENKVDFTKSRNLIISAVIFVSALGLTFAEVPGLSFTIGSASITFSGLAVAAVLGIVLNIVLPGKDYELTVTKDVEAAEAGADIKL